MLPVKHFPSDYHTDDLKPPFNNGWIQSILDDVIVGNQRFDDVFLGSFLLLEFNLQQLLLLFKHTVLFIFTVFS